MWAVRLSNKFVQAWGRCTTGNRDMIKTNSNIIPFRTTAYTWPMGLLTISACCITLHDEQLFIGNGRRWTLLGLGCLTILASFNSKPGHVCIYIYILKYTHQKLSIYIEVKDIIQIRMSTLYLIVLMQTKPATNTFILPSINIEI